MRTYQPSPRGQAPPVTWRQWLLPLGAAAGIVGLLALSPGAPSGPPLRSARSSTTCVIPAATGRPGPAARAAC